MPTGQQPQPRSFHACAAVGSRVVVTGGRGPSDEHFQDFHVFDTGELPRCSGDGISPEIIYDS